MNGYTCIKPCTFGGVAYMVGDAIPSEAVLPSRERALIKQGFIAPAVETESLLEENKSLMAKVAALEKRRRQSRRIAPRTHQRAKEHSYTHYSQRRRPRAGNDARGHHKDGSNHAAQCGGSSEGCGRDRKRGS